jgi:hypothetical protein
VACVLFSIPPRVASLPQARQFCCSKAFCRPAIFWHLVVLLLLLLAYRPVPGSCECDE